MAMDAADLAVWGLDLASDELTTSAELNRLFGFPPDARPTAEDLRARYAPGERERLERLGAEALARGETRLKTELRHLWPDGTVKWLLVHAQNAPPRGGGGPRVIGVVLDITERKQFEEQLELIARELQHRVKNSLAVTLNLARQSFQPQRTIAEGMDVFSGRLLALSAATDVMVDHDWHTVDVAELVERATAPFRGGNADAFNREGSSILVPGRAAISVALAIHELCTNATKYGALSVPEGRVLISWRREEDSMKLTWMETGGPPVQAPTHAGFGLKLLRQGALGDLGGHIDLIFEPTGVQCTIHIPDGEKI